MALKKSSHALRSDITKYTKELPVKKRVSKKSEEVLPMEEIKQLQAEPEVAVEPLIIADESPKDEVKQSSKPKRVRKANKKKD